MFQSGAFVAEYVDPVSTSQVQPNGVDLTVASVEAVTGGGELRVDGKTVGDRTPVDAEDGRFELSPGTYVVAYGERVSIPDGHLGFILPRSSLLRNGASLHTAVWDTGYEGRGEGLLTVGAPLALEVGARIGQFVLAGGEHDGTYDGTYQGEGL